MSKDPNLPGKPSQAVSQFLDRVARTPVKSSGTGAGRLIFALDATASREPMWDSACRIQAEMFAETASLGGLQVQLCYYWASNSFIVIAGVLTPDACRSKWPRFDVSVVRPSLAAC